jgi:hypothetical protein
MARIVWESKYWPRGERDDGRKVFGEAVNVEAPPGPCAWAVLA